MHPLAGNGLDVCVFLCDVRARVRGEAPLIAQTLHGYDQGHRLLASGGHVNEDEFALLDRLSDLSGYVPVGTEFDHYYTGFPCGRYYAFACTWPDRTARRAGTVLTHTLMIPRNLLATIHDLWSVPGHRRPESAQDRAFYQDEPTLDLTGAARFAPPPEAHRAADLITLWFGQPDRPVMWTEEGGAEDVVRHLWSLLWPEARDVFSFCTFSLQVRHLRRQPFGFLVLPPSAVGSFHDRARSPAWWRDGRMLDPVLREKANQTWVRTIVEQGGAATHAMWRYCAENGLAQLDAVAYPVFHRFVELEHPAKLRLTAARARADLLERLWPTVDPQHALVKETLGLLVQHQPDAPMAPRPFWDLVDLMKRPGLEALLDVDSEFASRVAVTISNETLRRILEADDCSGIGELMAIAKPRLRGAILEATDTAFSRLTDDSMRTAKGASILTISVTAQAAELVLAVLQSLSSSSRVAIAVRALESLPAEGRVTLADYVLGAAQRLDDIATLIEVWFILGQPLRALAEATKMVLAKSDIRPEPLAKILGRLSPEQRLSWALGVRDAPLVVWAGKHGALAAKDLGFGLAKLVERCSGQPNAKHVLIAYIEGISWASVKDEDLFHPAISVILRDGIEGEASKRLADALAPRLVSRVARGGWDVHEAAGWFSIAAVQMALANATDWILYSSHQGARAWDQDCLPNLARAFAECIRVQAPKSLLWVANVSRKPLQDTPPSGFSRAINDLVLLVETPSSTEGWLVLAAHVLRAARQHRGKYAFLLVERLFPVLYPLMVNGQLSPAALEPLRAVVFWRDWDLAKNWRHWLLDVWLGERWPPASFLRSLGDDAALFRRIVYRAWHREKAKDFVKSLSGAWGQDELLAEQWRGPVRRFLADPDAAADYE